MMAMWAAKILLPALLGLAVLDASAISETVTVASSCLLDSTVQAISPSPTLVEADRDTVDTGSWEVRHHLHH